MRSVLKILIMLLIFDGAQSQPANGDYDLVIGTYTNPEQTNGIHVYRFNQETADATPLTVNTEVHNPSYLAITHDGKNLYAVSEAGQGNGKVYAFSFDVSTGGMKMLNGVLSNGDDPCYISVDSRNQVVFVANYSSGTLSAIKLKPDGSFDSHIQTIRHSGSGPDKSRQATPHVHSVVLSPDERFLFASDLGTDKINIYQVDPSAAEPLHAADPGFVQATPASGPRHLTFHPKGRLAFLVQEIDGTVTAFEYRHGKLKTLQNISLLAPGFTGDVGAADIHVSPDGKFLYASNRGDANDIAIYSIGKKGTLTYLASQSTLGKAPRNFAIDPTGNFLLAANQNSNDIVVFKRDKETGLLSDTGKRIYVDKPVCLKFIQTH